MFDQSLQPDFTQETVPDLSHPPDVAAQVSTQSSDNFSSSFDPSSLDDLVQADIPLDVEAQTER